MSDTAPKPFVFVLMPFEASFGDVYQLGIKPAAEGAGAYCERIDEQIFGESILARIYNQIAKADLIVADMTGRNPNVFYEVGYAHALGRTVVLLTKNADDIPFDLKHYSHIVYQGSIAGLKEKLQVRIAHHLANPTKHTKYETALPNFTISGNLIEAGACIEASVSEPIGSEVALAVGITNPQDTALDWTELSAGLLLPAAFTPTYPNRAVQVAEKRYLYDLGAIGRLFPGAWETRVVDLPFQSVAETNGEQIEAELMVFTPNGPRSTPFHLKFS